MRVAIVAEYYPRAADPVLGVWAHRQALAARDAGAEVRVLVLHRPVPSRAAIAARDPRALLAPLRQPLRTELDGIDVRYVPFLAPPRPRTYGRWGAWAAPTLRHALRTLRREFPYDLVHAHYAAPAGDAVRRARPGTPVVVSVHGGDVLAVARRSAAGAAAVRAGLAQATLVLANSAGIAARARELGARRTTVVHLGTELPPARAERDLDALVTVAHLVGRKRHADVLRALWLLQESHPELRYDIVGDGPERGALERLAGELGIAGRVRFHGELPPAAARAAAQAGGVFVLPSVDEAFGVAYVEAMAGGVPAIGCRGEPGPEEIAALGPGLRLVPPGDPEALAAELRALLDEPEWRRELGRAARATVEAEFTWQQCGRATVAAYEAAVQERGLTPFLHAGSTG
jgi:glycosyltransferase involved in cell wall biosynthesis